MYFNPEPKPSLYGAHLPDSNHKFNLVFVKLKLLLAYNYLPLLSYNR